MIILHSDNPIIQHTFVTQKASQPKEASQLFVQKIWGEDIESQAGIKKKKKRKSRDP